MLATVLVPVSGVGAQAGPTKVLGPDGGDSDPEAVPGFGRVTLRWSAPSNDGGSPIVGYEYTYSSGPPGSTETDKGVWYPIPGSTGSTTSYTVTGLRNGESHTFKLRAVNAAGQKGTSSDDANSVTPTALPQAPGGLMAEPTDSKITLSWTQRNSSDGQTEATGWVDLVRYEYQQKTGDGDWTPWNVVTASDKNTQQFEITGLTNGVVYRFRLRAVNANGAGPGAETRPVVASGTPGRPHQVRAVPGDESVTLSWSPSSDGGSPIIGWEYRGADTDTGITSSTPWTRIPGSGAGTTSHVVTGLANTKDYRFQVRAVNINGAGTASSETGIVQPGSAPPAVPTAAPAPESTWFRQALGEDSITLKWAGPRNAGGSELNDGGSPLIRYEYSQKSGGGEWSQWMIIPANQTFKSPDGTYANVESSTELAELDDPEARAYKVTGLTAGTAYRFRVRAVNRIGAGPYVETSGDLYPGTVPLAPSSFAVRPNWDTRAGVGRVVLSWTSGGDGGSPVTKWQYKRANDAAGLSSKTTWTNLCDNTEGAEPGCASLSSITIPRVPPDGSLPDEGFEGYVKLEQLFMLRAVNSFGDGFPSSIVRVNFGQQTPGAPRFVTLEAYNSDPTSDGRPMIGFGKGRDHTRTSEQANFLATKHQYSWRIGDGSWGPWRDHDGDPELFDEINFKVGETYQVRYRHVNDNGTGPSTESPKFVFGGPPIPGGNEMDDFSNAVFTARDHYYPVLKVVAGTSQVTLSLVQAAVTGGGAATTDMTGFTPTSAIRWEYSYKVGSGEWGAWTFANHGEQFNNGNADFVVDGLTSGVEHRFRIRAVFNSLPGVSLESAPVTPGAAPPAPSGLSAAGGDRQVTLTWASAGSGGPAITKWQYCDFSSSSECDAAGDWTDVPGGNAATSVVVPRLTNGTSYTFRVRAVNVIGGGATAQALPVTPGRVPSAPVRVLVDAGDGQVTLRVTKPSQNHGNRVVGYEVRKKRAGEPWDAWEALGTTVAAGADVTTVRPSAETTGAVVRNLENGISHLFQVRAKNSYGPGAHLETSAVVPIGPPSAGRLSARAGDAQVVLSWSGTGSGGSTIAGWEYRQRRGDGGYGTWVGIAGSAPTTRSHTVTGLSNGVAYRFEVRALTTNPQLSGFAFESESVVPSTVPPRPVSVVATRGDGSVTLSWVAGASGRAGEATWASITTGWQYRMRTADGTYGDWTAIAGSDAATNSHVVAGLTNGVSYGFEVRAMNAMGPGPAASASATPATVPPAPEVTARAGDAEVTLSWTSNGDGGSAITGWQSRTDDGEWSDLSVSGINTVLLPNLDNGTAYVFEVRAVNAVGEGSAGTTSATPAGAPPAPEVTARAGDAEVTLSWTPNGDGGSPITGWHVRTDDGEWVDLSTMGLGADASSHVVSGLTNGTAHTFGVRATNAVGAGSAASVSATPAAPPAAPEVTVTGGDEEITLTWASAGDGGSTITGWRYRMRIGVGDYGEWVDLAADVTSTSFTGLDGGTGVVAYVFGVRAINEIGAGAVATSDPVTPTAASAVGDDYYSGVVTGPNFCADRSLGGARLFALDGDGDGVADTCSLPYTRREAIARQNAVITLANRYPERYKALVNAACAEVAGNQPCGGEELRSPGYAPVNNGGPYYSGIITGPSYCANASLGGPTTYPLDSDGDGVADVCSLPYTRREAIARQKAGDALAAMHLDEFKSLLGEECRRLHGTGYGDTPTDLTTDICAR